MMTWRCHISIIVVLGISLMACAPGEERTAQPTASEEGARPRIQFNQDPATAAYGTVDVVGFEAALLNRLRQADLTTEAWSAFFAVFTSDTTSADPSMPPVLGRYSVVPPVIRFTPRFPFVAGLTYRVRVDGAALHTHLLPDDAAEAHTLEATFTVPPRAASPPTVVTEVYPTADTLPMNQLKFYIHFSAPMDVGQAYAHLRLIDQKDQTPVAAPFVEIDPELWDPQRRRFTLLFDPGRIKREVGPNREVGVPLQAGHAYRLVIDRRWRDAAGRPLQDDFVKTFQVVEADRAVPDPDAWRLTAPAADRVDPVVLAFPEPLDHALLQRLITVHDAAGARLDGTVATARHETQWSFTPTAPWQAGAYTIHVETILEDLAGNTLRSLFDIDLTDAPPSEVREAEKVRVLPFVVKAVQ